MEWLPIILQYDDHGNGDDDDGQEEVYWISICPRSSKYRIWVSQVMWVLFPCPSKANFIFIKCHEKAFYVVTCDVLEKAIFFHLLLKKKLVWAHDKRRQWWRLFLEVKKITIIITQSARHDLFQSIEIACCSPWWSCAINSLWAFSLTHLHVVVVVGSVFLSTQLLCSYVCPLIKFFSLSFFRWSCMWGCN